MPQKIRAKEWTSISTKSKTVLKVYPKITVRIREWIYKIYISAS